MSQRGIFKILNRKDGKGIVTNAKDDDEIKVTKVLEFIPATKPQDAKEGRTIQFFQYCDRQSLIMGCGRWMTILRSRVRIPVVCTFISIRF